MAKVTFESGELPAGGHVIGVYAPDRDNEKYTLCVQARGTHMHLAKANNPADFINQLRLFREVLDAAEACVASSNLNEHIDGLNFQTHMDDAVPPMTAPAEIIPMELPTEYYLTNTPPDDLKIDQPKGTYYRLLGGGTIRATDLETLGYAVANKETIIEFGAGPDTEVRHDRVFCLRCKRTGSHTRQCITGQKEVSKRAAEFAAKKEEENRS